MDRSKLEVPSCGEAYVLSGKFYAAATSPVNPYGDVIERNEDGTPYFKSVYSGCQCDSSSAPVQPVRVGFGVKEGE
jgi:hypothetical protein